MGNKYSVRQDYKAVPRSGILFACTLSVSFTIASFIKLTILSASLLPTPPQAS